MATLSKFFSYAHYLFAFNEKFTLLALTWAKANILNPVKLPLVAAACRMHLNVFNSSVYEYSSTAPKLDYFSQ